MEYQPLPVRVRYLRQQLVGLRWLLVRKGLLLQTGVQQGDGLIKATE